MIDVNIPQWSSKGVSVVDRNAVEIFPMAWPDNNDGIIGLVFQEFVSDRGRVPGINVSRMRRNNAAQLSALRTRGRTQQQLINIPGENCPKVGIKQPRNCRMPDRCHTNERVEVPCRRTFPS